MKTHTILRGTVLGMVLGAVALTLVLLVAAPVAHGHEEQPGDAGQIEPLHTSGSVTFTVATYLPVIIGGVGGPEDEVRALWVTRFDWTHLGVTPTLADVQRVVSDAAYAGFNTIFFQVRGAGDAYYAPGPEPWASRLTGTTGPSLGRDPGWDPLAAMITLSHASGISVHAYINVYPAWQAPPSSTYGLLTPTLNISPPQWLNQLTYGPENHGVYHLGYTWRVYDSITHPMPIAYNQYVWASPAVTAVQDSVVSVATYLASHYALDGIHLDNVRYPGPAYSYDPFTVATFSQALQISQTLTFTDWRGDFQRAQVSNLVARIYSQTTNGKSLLSAAVWPHYADGRDNYFQDSKAWLLAGTIDAIAPMLYSSDVITDLVKWTEAAQDFQAAANGRWMLPGIGVVLNSGACVSFDQITARIQTARTLGAAGQTIFSYSGLRDCREGQLTYLDLLRNGPYAAPASLPPVTWK